MADSVSSWLDWTEQNRTIWLATLGRGEDIADPDIRAVVTGLVRSAVANVAKHHADIAHDSPRLRYLHTRTRPADLRHPTKAKPAPLR